MEILCPNCQKKLTIGDQHAGSVMRCPMCMGMFTAPALPPFTPPPPPPAPPPPSPPPPMMELPSSAPPSPAVAAGPPPYVAAAAEPAPGAPPPPRAPPTPPGDYTRSLGFRLRPDVLPWFAPIAVILIFFLSFPPWAAIAAEGLSFNLWTMAFGVSGVPGSSSPAFV